MTPPSAVPTAARRPATPVRRQAEPDASLFHEPWWLAAATGGVYHEATVSSGGQTVGRLPYVITRHMGFTACRMPPFTHVLGPLVQPGTGKPQSQFLRRLSIVRDLIDQLPKASFCKQAFNLSLIDGLAFQDRGFQVTPQYTFQIDCRDGLEGIWDAMHFKTRQHIRRAEEKLAVSTVADPYEFISSYQTNIRKAGRRCFIDFTTFPALIAEVQARNCGVILRADWPDSKPAAMVVLVWGHGRMYYLLSTRARDHGDNGSINLLLWEAIKLAHKHGLLFDLDGVSTSGTARFLSGFGGQYGVRIIAQRAGTLYEVLRTVKRHLGRGKADDTSTFT